MVVPAVARLLMKGAFWLPMTDEYALFSIATNTIWSKYFPPEAPRACGSEMVRARSRTIDSARPKVVFVCSSTLDYCKDTMLSVQSARCEQEEADRVHTALNRAVNCVIQSGTLYV